MKRVFQKGLNHFHLRFTSNFIPLRSKLLNKHQLFTPLLIQLPRRNLFTSITTKTKRLLLGKARPWKLDDFLALGSWFFVGNSLFFLIGTTTFVSSILFLLNSLQFQGNPFIPFLKEYLVKKISDYMTQATGFEISFQGVESTWVNGAKVIRLSNVTAICNHDTWFNYLKNKNPLLKKQDVDGNFTYWNLNFKNIDLTLSVWRWLEGKGFVSEMKLKGIRGDVERNHIIFSPNWKPKRRSPQPGDFDYDKFVIEDLLLNVQNPNFRPFSLSVFYAECPRLRKQWLFYDFISANSIVGVFDNCLFSVHKPQDNNSLRQFNDGKKLWSKMSHLKIHGVPIDHLNTGATGPFGWITKGLIDIDLQVMIPQSTNQSLMSIVKDEIHDIKERTIDVFDEFMNLRPYSTEIKSDSIQIHHPSSKVLKMEWDVRLKDLRASIPLTTQDLTVFNNAMMRPVVAYMNSHKTHIPLSFTADMNMSEFDGSWTIYDCHMVDVLSTKVGEALSKLVNDEKERAKQLRRIGKNILTIFDYAERFRNPMISLYGLPVIV